MANYAPMKGGLWNPGTRPAMSAQTQNLLKGGDSLPTNLGPTSVIKEKKPQPVIIPEKRVNPRSLKKGGVRKLENIVDSGAYERPDYKPRPLKGVTEKDKDRLANIMAYGKDLSTNPFNIERDSSPEPEPELDRFDELRLEIEERKEFLAEMDELGKGKEYRQMILTEISQKIREMEIIDKNRTQELKLLIQQEQQKKN